MKLYEIDSEIQAIYDEIEANEGVLPDELETALNMLQMERTTKIDNIIKLYRNIAADETAIEVEITRLTKKLQSTVNRKQSVKNFLAYAIGEGNKFKNEIASVYWKSSESVQVPEDCEKLPEQYVRTKIEKSPDKKAIGEALKAGIVLEGCSIMHKTSIVVR